MLTVLALFGGQSKSETPICLQGKWTTVPINATQEETRQGNSHAHSCMYPAVMVETKGR